MKKWLTFFLLLGRKPIFWLWKAIFHPSLTIGYRLYLWSRQRWLSVYEPAKDRAAHALTANSAVQGAVIVLTFLVTASNLYAGETPGDAEGYGGQSILASILEKEEEQLVVEEAGPGDNVRTEERKNGSDTSYFDGLAIEAAEYYENEVITGHGEGEGEHSQTPIVGAVRVQPDAGAGEALPPTRTQVTEYAVESGDVIGAISRKFGLRADSVLIANGLSAQSVIRPGQKLKIPPVDGILYTTKKGDTLDKISKTYKSDLKKIVDANGLPEGAPLAVGTVLMLPDGRLPPPPPRPAPSRTGNLRDVFIPPSATDRVGLSRLLWPTSARRITQYFKRRHAGVDIAGPVGTPIYASDDGAVIFSGWNRGGYGNMIIVDHGNGLFTRYAHSSKNLVKVGDGVKRGDTIALMGSTGRSTGPHIHYEVMTGATSRRVNPFDYIR